MPVRNLGWLLGIAAVAGFGFAVSHSAPSREKDRDYEMVRLVVDVLHKVRHEYVTEVDPERERKLVEDMINGGLERLDQHSQYINPHDYKQFEKTSKGKFGGVGIEVGYDRQKGGVLSVVSPIPGTPAYDAGVLAGDVIVKIDGKPTEGLRRGEAVDMIQGEPGQKVTLTVLHEGAKEPVDIDIVRAEIDVQVVMGDHRKPDDPKEWEFFIDKENKIGYVRVTGFSETAAKELKKAVARMQEQGLRGLVIDLRNNPGGLLRSAVEICKLFVSEGRIVSTKGRNHKDDVYDASKDDTILPADKCPMAILINRYSASASEIVAACLQDHNRAVIVGERSYGKGSVQNMIEMKEGNEKSALKLTTASYWRPSGENIHRFPEPWFKLTDKSLAALRAAHVSEPVVAKLGGLKDRMFVRREQLVEEFGRALDKDELAEFQTPVVNEAAKAADEWGVKPSEGFEVKLSDDERLEYLLDRSRRDIVRGKTSAPEPPKNDKDKTKKPFEDRVLNKALERLRGEIKHAEARPPLPEVWHG